MEAKKACLRAAIDRTELRAHEAFFLKHLRPAIALVPTTPQVTRPQRYNNKKMELCQGMVSETTLPLGSSRFGGKPDLPAHFEWPKHEYGPYRFLGQINMREMRDVCAAACEDASDDAVKSVFDAWLPPRAAGTTDFLLSFFFAEDSEERFFWREYGFIKVFPFDLDDATLTLRTTLPAIGESDSYNTLGTIPVRPEPVWALPGDESEFPDHSWPLTKDEVDSYEYQEGIAQETKTEAQWKSGFLFGYPLYHTLCYDPTPSPDALSEPERKCPMPKRRKDEHGAAPALKRYVPLLNVPSYYEELGWCWMDGDRLMTFIDVDDLAKGDFSTILAEAG